MKRVMDVPGLEPGTLPGKSFSVFFIFSPGSVLPLQHHTPEERKHKKKSAERGGGLYRAERWGFLAWSWWSGALCADARSLHGRWLTHASREVREASMGFYSNGANVGCSARCEIQY